MSEPSIQDLRDLAEMRLKDAEILLNYSRFSAAYYLAGYSVECGIKAIIAHSFRSGVIPRKEFVNKVYTHQLAELINLAGLASQLKASMDASDAFRNNWAIASSWNESMRYETVDPFKARDIVDAVRQQGVGVLPWLKQHW